MNKTPAKKRILIVDDDPVVMKMFSTLLVRGGYEVIQASYALPALFRAGSSPPDLILADLKMPMMNGMEMIELFKGHVDTRDIPIVVVTGSDSEESRKAAFKAGCAGYLTKPIKAAEFLAQIEKFLQGHKSKKP
jgi:two-component system, cell cycle response regulator DivK